MNKMMKKPFNEYFTIFPVLETERLILRQIREEDEPAIKEMLEDFETQKYFGYYDPVTGITHPEFEGKDAKNRTYAENVNFWYKEKAEMRFIIEGKKCKSVIGEVYMFDFVAERMAEIGYRVNRRFWGQGIATEAVKAVTDFAFDIMGLKRLHLKCFTINPASSRIAEKAGFKREGKIRQGLALKVFTDYYVYGMIEEDRC